ncbi:hypothetical protein C8R46DRAFT_140414 [Mycena filopes]|nr:hypothetical protein C8R46DRAFT_140414 [Mycena filopes]
MVATQNIPCGAQIYELIGMLSLDEVTNAHTKNLSKTFAWNSTKQVLFGPIRYVNHSCKANTFRFLENLDLTIVLQATRDIFAGEAITVDCGTDYFQGECICEHCLKDVPPAPSRPSRIVDPQLRAESRRAKRAARNTKASQLSPGGAEVARKLR